MIKILIAQKMNTDTAAFIENVESLPFGVPEKERLMNIKNNDTAKASLAAYLALKTLIEPLGYKNLTIKRNAYGKPFFEHHPNLPFNISHSGDLSVAAICDNGKCQSIGVDIEFKKDRLDFKKIADRFFGNEKSEVQTQDDFLILWTNKEALSKMRGGALNEAISLPSENADCYKVEFNNKTAYMSIHYESALKSQEIKIFTDCNNISITKIKE